MTSDCGKQLRPILGRGHLEDRGVVDSGRLFCIVNCRDGYHVFVIDLDTLDVQAKWKVPFSPTGALAVYDNKVYMGARNEAARLWPGIQVFELNSTYVYKRRTIGEDWLDQVFGLCVKGDNLYVADNGKRESFKRPRGRTA